MIQYEEHPAVSNGFGSRQLETDYARSLSTLIENEIIPRLMVAHAAVTAPATVPATMPTMVMVQNTVIGPEEIAAFAPLAMQVEADALLLHVEAILSRGVAIDTVLVDLLAPTARLLAEFWEDERCDFVDVTMALWRLQEIVHDLSRRLTAKQRSALGGRQARSVGGPGHEREVGAVIDDIFKRDGWPADRLGPAPDRRADARGRRDNRIDRKI